MICDEQRSQRNDYHKNHPCGPAWGCPPRLRMAKVAEKPEKLGDHVFYILPIYDADRNKCCQIQQNVKRSDPLYIFHAKKVLKNRKMAGTRHGQKFRYTLNKPHKGRNQISIKTSSGIRHQPLVWTVAFFLRGFSAVRVSLGFVILAHSFVSLINYAVDGPCIILRERNLIRMRNSPSFAQLQWAIYRLSP